MAEDESALAAELLRLLAKFEEPQVREAAYRAAITAVEAWGMRPSLVSAPSRVKSDVALAMSIAAGIDADSLEGLQALVPWVIPAEDCSAKLIEYFKDGPMAWAAKTDLDPRRLADLRAGRACQVPIDGSLWSILDNAGGQLERRKAISGVPDYAMELCGAYTDAHQFLVLQPPRKPQLGYLCSAVCRVVLYGAETVKVWRLTDDNLASVVSDRGLGPPNWTFKLTPGDSIVIPPGFPYHVFDAPASVSWCLQAVTPGARCVLRHVRAGHFLCERRHKALLAFHLDPDRGDDEWQPIDLSDEGRVLAHFNDLDDRLKHTRKARFRKRKRQR